MTPSLDALEQSLIVDSERDTPLHAQVRRALRGAIEDHFEDGAKFWPENLLTQHLGVSQGTVRRALADLTREGLLQRHVAKGTFVCKQREARTSVVGVFVPEWDSELYAMALEQLAHVCREKNHRLRIYHTHKGEKTADAYRQIESAPQDEGLILLANPTRTTWELFEALDDRGYRTVNIGIPIKGYPGAYIGTNGEAGVRQGVEHLMQLGHRRIVFLSNEPEDNPAIAERVADFEKLCAAHGLTESRVVHCGTKFWDCSNEAAYRAMNDVWELQPRPTAIFAASDQGAWAVLKWTAERGIRVPDELSVLGYDDVRPSRFMYPALSSIAQPLPEIARRAVELLWDDKEKRTSCLLEPKLVVRRSTATLASK